MARALSRDRSFDRSRDFLAKRPITIQGQGYSAGSLIDKSLLPTRRLRALYEQRRLDMADPVPPAPEPYRRLRAAGPGKWVGQIDGVDATAPMDKPTSQAWKAGDDAGSVEA